MENICLYAFFRSLSACLLLTLCGWIGAANPASAQTDVPAITLPGDTPAIPSAADKPLLAAPDAPPAGAPADNQPKPGDQAATDKPQTDKPQTDKPQTDKPLGDSPAAAPVTPAPPAPAENHFGNGIPGSLFLSQQDHIRISNAIADYKNSLLPHKAPEPNSPSGNADNGGGGSSATTAPTDPTQPVTEQQQEVRDPNYGFPQFFLESLVYHAPGDWSVRVNGKKITPQTLTDNAALVVVAIDKNAVLFRWKPKEMFRVLEVWDKMPASQTAQKQDIHNIGVEMKFDSKVLDKVPEMPIIVDKERRLVTFTLRPNQTFSSYVMKVLEGKVRPVAPDAPTDGSPAPTPAPAPAPAPVVVPPPPSAAPAPAPVVDDSISGLNGLMKTINNEKQIGAP